MYKKGITNRVADALSRAHHTTATLDVVSVAQPQWLQFLQDSYQNSSEAQTLLTALSIQSPHGHYTLVQGIIRYKNVVWLGHSLNMQTKVMHQFHSSPLGGHSGYFVTYVRIRKLFYWPHMKQSIQTFVAGCQVCQQAKAERVPYPGLLQPLEVPAQAWQTITMDFIESLPVSSSFNCILVIVDKFSKYAHFIKLKHPFSALHVA